MMNILFGMSPPHSRSTSPANVPGETRLVRSESRTSVLSSSHESLNQRDQTVTHDIARLRELAAGNPEILAVVEQLSSNYGDLRDSFKRGNQNHKDEKKEVQAKLEQNVQDLEPIVQWVDTLEGKNKALQQNSSALKKAKQDLSDRNKDLAMGHTALKMELAKAKALLESDPSPLSPDKRVSTVPLADKAMPSPLRRSLSLPLPVEMAELKLDDPSASSA